MCVRVCSLSLSGCDCLTSIVNVILSTVPSTKDQSWQQTIKQKCLEFLNGSVCQSIVKWS